MVGFSEQKLDFIREITNLEDEAVFMAIVYYYSSLKQNREEVARKFAIPIRKKLDPELLKRQQHFKGHDRVKMLESLQKIDIPQSIETLLAQVVK